MTLELPADTTSELAFDEIAPAEFQQVDTPLARFCRTLDAVGLLDSVEIAVPGDHSRASQLLAVREAVPAAVNARVGRAQASIDGRIAKTAADMIVPFERLAELMNLSIRSSLAAGSTQRSGDTSLTEISTPTSSLARWTMSIRARKRYEGSDARSFEWAAHRLRNMGSAEIRIKQELLRELYGNVGIEEMRAVKRSLDPEYKLAAGVIFGER